MDVKTGLIVSLLVAVVGLVVAVEVYDKANPEGAETGERRLCECMILCQTIILIVLLAIW